MAEVISQREFRNESGAIMKRVEEGESFVITSNGRTIAELRPLHRGRSISRDVALAAFSGAARIDFDVLRRDLDSIVNPYIDLGDA